METTSKTRANVYRFFNEALVITVCFTFACILLQHIYHSNIDLINIWMLPVLIVGWYFSTSRSSYSMRFDTRSVLTGIYKIFNAIVVQFCLVVLFFFSLHQTFNTRRFLVFYIGLLFILIPLERIIYGRLMLYLHRTGVNARRILIIGAGRIGMEFSGNIEKNPHLGYEIMGYLDDEEKPYLNGKYLGKIDKLDEYINNHLTNFDEVVVALPNKAQHRIRHIASLVSNHTVKLRIIPAYHELIDSNYNVSIFNGFPMITVRNEPLDEIHLRVIKRLFDTVFAVLVLVLIGSWLFPLIALAILIDSPGPVFFRQERWGRRNQMFRVYKFRSMVTTASSVHEDDGSYQQARKNDSRITTVGAFLRKTSLDELPQFINVIMGCMSVVGPRPHPTPLNVESRQVVDNYLVRHAVKPGITGWAQVNGFRGETPDPALMRARVNYDIWYIENWSLLLDVRIIFLTFWKVIVGDKNAF